MKQQNRIIRPHLANNHCSIIQAGIAAARLPYRLYYTMRSNTIIFMLIGGNKGKLMQAINAATKTWGMCFGCFIWYIIGTYRLFILIFSTVFLSFTYC